MAGALRSLMLVAAMMLPTVLPATAADARSQTYEQADDAPAATSEAYLERRATLLLLRARFDVISDEDVPRMLAADAATLSTRGPSDEALDALASDLLAEGSYYIVSLRYLIESGGSLWPADKAETTYVNDALSSLRALQVELQEVVAGAGDPLPIFARVDRINAWTEGFAESPAELDHFRDRDALVEGAVAGAAPVSL